MREPWLRLALIGVVGAVLGSLGEGAHHRAGVWTLPEGASLPWWVAVAYVVAIPSVAMAYRWMDGRVGVKVAPTRSAALLEGVAVLALFVSPALLHPHEIVLAGALWACLLARMVLVRAPGDAWVVVVAMVVDTALELCLASLGLFEYAHASAGPLPLWLAPFWGCMGLSLRRLFASVLPAPVERD